MRTRFAARRRLWLVVALVVALTAMSAAARPLARWISNRSAAAMPDETGAALGLLEQGFGQDGARVGYAFLVENADAAQAVQNSEYRVTAFDAAGTPLKDDAGPIVLLMPRQTLGVGGTIFGGEGVAISRIDVQLKSGSPAAVQTSPPLTVDTVRLRADASGAAAASGVVRNPFDRRITDVRASVVAYDAAGRIVGGGFAYLAFIPASGAVGVISSLASRPDVARVEMYASFSEKSQVTARGEGLPPGASEPVLTRQGFGQPGALGSTQLGYALLIQNPNQDFAVQGTQYHVTAYGEDGSVLATDDGRVETLLPGQTLGVAGAISLDTPERVARAEAYLLPGPLQMSGPAPGFIVENVANRGDGSPNPRVTGQVVNPYGRDVADVRVSAVAYDAAGDIIGGGYTFLDLAPANGRAPVEVPLVAEARPARVELHAAQSALSDRK